MLYQITLIDYATPNFVSATKTYYGDKDAIFHVLNHLRANRPDMLEAANEFFEGRGPGIVQVYYSAPEAFIIPVKVIGENEKHFDNFSSDHLNVWDCIYKMAADHAACRCVYIEDSLGKLYRCLSAEFTNLSIDGTYGLIQREHFWGHPGIITNKCTGQTGADDKNLITINTLMCPDREFNNLKQLRKDMDNPQKLNFSPIFDDIFGNG